MKSKTHLACAVGALALSALSTQAFSATEADVKNSFEPYANGAPTAPGITVGMTLNASNYAAAGEAIDPALQTHLKNGEVEIVVGETTDLLLHPNYIKATYDHLNKTSLGANNGDLEGFIAGRPFPEEPDASDPRAGEKLAWNYKYGYNWGDSAAISPFYWRFKDVKTGNTERTIKYDFHFLNFMHRVNQEPLPEYEDNPSKIFRSIYVKVLEPFDLKDTQLLIYRYDNDQQRDDSWLYLGFQRRVRRLATGQVTDSFLGADLMIEDFEGYNGRISDYTWEYVKTVNTLLPFYNHDEVALTDEFNDPEGYQFVDFHGAGNCFPNITWQLRKAYLVEGKPADASHPIGKRLLYMDAQTFTIPRSVIYDRKGDIWKSFILGQAHPDHHLPKNKGSGVSIDDSFMVMDVQSQHCTTGQFKGQVDPSMNPRTLFTVQNMRSTGQ